MSSLRALTRTHFRLALLLVVLALAMKALLPGGFMVGSHTGKLSVEVCSDVSGGQFTKQIDVIFDDQPGDNGHGKSDSACPYSALSVASLTSADALHVALALAFIIALGFLPIVPERVGRPPFLRPPLRGPPSLA